MATAVLDLERAREVASRVVDPEIPVLTIADLGILRGVRRRRAPGGGDHHPHILGMPGDAPDRS